MRDTAPDHNPSAVEGAAHAAVKRALQADADTAERAAGYIADRAVLTLSRSGTVLDALLGADPPPRRVFVAESRPDREGVVVAETLADAGLDVTLLSDAGVAMRLSENVVDVVLVGADTVLANGALVNKTGTRTAALAADHESVPFYTTMATDKVATHDTPQLEDGPPAALYSGDAALDVRNPTFDVTPAGLISGYITEQGILHASEIRDLAFELEGWARWQED
jgi:translation initiation factor 2B subunit (eIF-2B alpha/beta/delta family)